MDMEPDARGGNGGNGTEDEQVLRLRAVLHDLVQRKGRAGAAKSLGLDPRTVDGCLDGGGLSWRVREALERAVQGDRGGEAARQRESIRALERRVEILEAQMAARPVNAGDGKETPGEERACAGREAEPPPGVPGAAKPSAPAADGDTGPERNSLGRRRYPELVCLEPAHDDREVYGDAWPLVEEWRELRKAGRRGSGRGLARLRAEERARTLEVAMLEERGLTLPPEKTPLHGLDRRDQLVWRRKALREVRRSLARAELRRWLRRKLTFGLWRN